MQAGERLVWMQPTGAAFFGRDKTHPKMESIFQCVTVDSSQLHRTVGDTTSQGVVHDGLAL